MKNFEIQCSIIDNSYKMDKMFSLCQWSSSICSPPLSKFAGEDIQQVINNDPHSTIAETFLSLSHNRVIHNYLKITSHWVSHQLTHEQQVKLNGENLEKFQNDSCRLCDIITDDET